MMLWPRTDPRTTKMGKLLQFELEKMIGIHSSFEWKRKIETRTAIYHVMMINMHNRLTPSTKQHLTGLEYSYQINTNRFRISAVFNLKQIFRGAADG